MADIQRASDTPQHVMREILQAYGFTIGERDPRLNTRFSGCRMVVEGSIAEIESDHELPTEDGRNGPWCVVGDDEDELVKSAFDYCISFDGAEKMLDALLTDPGKLYGDAKESEQ